ncbi:MAG: RdgB/HAM1 family non-canonical purine NTP pyrophosphatase [Alphaproteobacteria bacterium]
MNQAISFGAGDRLVVASHNSGKIAEIEALIRPFGIEIVAASALELDEPDETGSTFEENAAIKAVAAAKVSGLIALADDSGLAVDALDGDPGIYSARWAGPEKDFGRAMRLVEKQLMNANAATPADRRARFVAVLCLATPDGHTRHWRGEVEGVIVWPPRGEQGFGYDPIFKPDGHDRTFGEMSASEKHGWRPPSDPLSHRARAFARFARDLEISG